MRPALHRFLRGDDPIDEATVVGQILVRRGSAQQPRITDCALQVSVRTLDHSDLVSLAAVLAAQVHPVMRTEGFVADRQIERPSRLESRNAAERESLGCSPGTPPSAHSAFCSPSVHPPQAPHTSSRPGSRTRARTRRHRRSPARSVPLARWPRHRGCAGACRGPRDSVSTAAAPEATAGPIA